MRQTFRTLCCEKIGNLSGGICSVHCAVTAVILVDVVVNISRRRRKCSGLRNGRIFVGKPVISGVAVFCAPAAFDQPCAVRGRLVIEMGFRKIIVPAHNGYGVVADRLGGLIEAVVCFIVIGCALRIGVVVIGDHHRAVFHQLALDCCDGIIGDIYRFPQPCIADIAIRFVLSHAEQFVGVVGFDPRRVGFQLHPASAKDRRAGNLPMAALQERIIVIVSVAVRRIGCVGYKAAVAEPCQMCFGIIGAGKRAEALSDHAGFHTGHRGKRPAVFCTGLIFDRRNDVLIAQIIAFRQIICRSANGEILFHTTSVGIHNIWCNKIAVLIVFICNDRKKFRFGRRSKCQCRTALQKEREAKNNGESLAGFGLIHVYTSFFLFGGNM